MNGLDFAYFTNKATEAEIFEHLSRCNANFVPPLSDRVDIGDYSKKIIRYATRFETWSDRKLVGLVAAYCNDQKKRIAYLTSVTVLCECMGKGIASLLVAQCVDHAKASGMLQIALEVSVRNASAIKLYEKYGFVIKCVNAPFISMNLNLTLKGKQLGQRNCNIQQTNESTTEAGWRK